jgi:hypothetical protein
MKKITFPKDDAMLIIKKTDEENFKKNYQDFLKRIAD